MLKLWIVIIFGVVAVILSIIGLALPHWATYYHRDLGATHFGLWRTCSVENGCSNTGTN